MYSNSVNIHIGNAFASESLIRALIMSIEEKPEWFYPGIRITSVFDNSPGMIWNGGRVLTGNQLSLSEMKTAVDFYNERKIGVYFTFSNSMLTKEHLEDKFGNQILAAFENPVNGAIVCSELLKEYIHQNYPKYSVTLSVTRCCLEKNKLLELLPLYDMLVIPPEYNHNFNFLQQIPEPQKVELLLNEHCMPYCPRKSRHFELLSKIILGRATSQEINEEKCSYWDITKTEMCIPPEMYPVLTSLGIRHFKLATRHLGMLFEVDEIVKYLVKKEYTKVFKIYIFMNELEHRKNL